MEKLLDELRGHGAELLTLTGPTTAVLAPSLVFRYVEFDTAEPMAGVLTVTDESG